MGYRKSAGDHRLARNHRCEGRKENERQAKPSGREEEEWIYRGLGIGEEERALAHVIEDEAGIDEVQPRKLIDFRPK